MSNHNSCAGCMYDDKRNLCTHPDSNEEWFWDNDAAIEHFGYDPKEYWCKEIE